MARPFRQNVVHEFHGPRSVGMDGTLMAVYLVTATHLPYIRTRRVQYIINLPAYILRIPAAICRGYVRTYVRTYYVFVCLLIPI